MGFDDVNTAIGFDLIEREQSSVGVVALTRDGGAQAHGVNTRLAQEDRVGVGNKLLHATGNLCGPDETAALIAAGVGDFARASGCTIR